MIKFFEEDHLYLNGTEKYLSVTSLLHKLEHEKDWEQILQKTAKKRKVDPDVLRQEWKDENTKSIEKGKAYHTKKEEEMMSSTQCTEDGEVIPIYSCDWEDGVKVARPLKLDMGLYPELIIWMDSAKLAGQADVVEVIDESINIYDYKTNKKLDFHGFTSWDGRKEMLKFPVAHMPACNGSIYSLQLNMYMYMLLKHNPSLKVGKMTLLHVIEDADMGFVEIPYEVPNLQKEIHSIINLYKDKKL